MAQRFIHPEIWEKDEWLDASIEQKLLSIYIISTASSIGIFNKSLRLTSTIVGFEVTDELLLSLPVGVEKHKDGYWMPNFCFYQYGELKDTCKPHQSYIKLLKKEGLFDRVCIPYTKGIETLKEKEKDIDKDIDIVDKIEVSRKFYYSELEKAGEEKGAYLNFIKYLFANNSTGKPCAWLNLKYQVSYPNFVKLLKQAGEMQNIFDKIEIGLNRERKYIAGKANVYTTLKNWLQ